MKFALPPRKPMRENVIPLINIVFLLLIFFMIAGHMEQINPVQPPISSSRISEPAAENSLYLFADGNVGWKDRIYSLEAFRSEFSDKEFLPGEDKLMIRADQDRMANDFLRVLEILRSGGVKNIRLVTRQEAKR